MTAKIRKSYVSLPLDDASFEQGERAQWMPLLWVQIAGTKRTPRIPAIVDSGSAFCIFKSHLAVLAGIDDFKSGKKRNIGGVIAGVTEPIYFHRVRLFVEKAWCFEIEAGFVEKFSLTAILGLSGFFSNAITVFDHSVSPPHLEVEKINRA